jgi:glycosyltransferase involved in cell wall biosynthesis
MSVPLSVLIITGNEEINIRQALDNVCGWADQVFVVDSFSTDRTAEIAREMGAQVVQNPWPGYAAQRNWALDHLPFRNEWVFVLDADEYLSDELKLELAEILAEDGRGFDGFYVNRRFIFYGKWIRHCGWYPCWILRLFRYRLGRYENRPVDEHVLLNGKTSRCNHDLIHRDLHDMSYWITKHIRYAQLNALAYEQIENKKGAEGRIRPNLFGSQAERRRFIKEHVWRHLPARGFLFFLYLYVFRRGFLDGEKGRVFCQMHGIFEELKVAIQWEKNHLQDLTCWSVSHEQHPSAASLSEEGSTKV